MYLVKQIKYKSPSNLSCGLILFGQWAVVIWLTQPMANSVTLEEQHLERLQTTVAIQATTWWEIGLALVKLQGCGLEVHLPVKVSCYHIIHINLCAHSTGKHIVMMYRF